MSQQFYNDAHLAAAVVKAIPGVDTAATAASVTPATLTTALTDITHTAPGTADYALQDLTDTGGFGFKTKDEGNTLLAVVANLQARLAEVETQLALVNIVA